MVRVSAHDDSGGVTMPYGVALTDVFASDGGHVWDGYLYLPGEPCDVSPDYLCTHCQHPMRHAGSADPATGADVPQDPAEGRHDGIVALWYAPIPGVRPIEAEAAHLRCLAEAAEAGSVILTLAAGIVPPESARPFDGYPDPRHLATRA
jgi:hypothetical protein